MHMNLYEMRATTERATTEPMMMPIVVVVVVVPEEASPLLLEPLEPDAPVGAAEGVALIIVAEVLYKLALEYGIELSWQVVMAE